MLNLFGPHFQKGKLTNLECKGIQMLVFSTLNKHMGSKFEKPCKGLAVAKYQTAVPVCFLCQFWGSVTEYCCIQTETIRSH